MNISWWGRASLLAALLVLGACVAHNNIRTVQPEDAHQPGDILTVMSFNIRVGYGRSKPRVSPYQLRLGPEKLEPIISAIRSVEPDIVGLQEVLLNRQTKKIAKALNLNYTFSPHPGNRSWWGVAILSKYPIINVRTVPVSYAQRGSRSASIATIDVGGTSMVFASVHKTLDKFLSDGSWFRNLKSAITGSGLPTVLIGDFNVLPGDRRFKLLGSNFLDTARAVDTVSTNEVRATGTFGPTGQRIDYILVRKSEFEIIDAGVVGFEHRMASDHYAYFAKIKSKL